MSSSTGTDSMSTTPVKVLGVSNRTPTKASGTKKKLNTSSADSTPVALSKSTLGKENKTENLDHLVRAVRENEKKRKNRASMGRVSFANTVEVRFFEKHLQRKNSLADAGTPQKSPSKSPQKKSTTASSSPFGKGPKAPLQLQQLPQPQQQQQHNQSMDDDDGQQTMELTATFPGRIFVPFIRDEVQPLCICDASVNNNSNTSMDISAMSMSMDDTSMSMTLPRIPTLGSILDLEEQEEKERNHTSARHEANDEEDLYTSNIKSPVHKRTKGPAGPMPPRQMLAAEDEDFNEIFKHPVTPIKSSTTTTTTTTSSSPIPTLTDLYEEDMTGNFKDIIAKLDNASSHHSSVANHQLEDSREYPEQDLTTEFHLANGTQGAGGRLTNLLDTTSEIVVEVLPPVDHVMDDGDDNAGDMSMTQALGHIVQMGTALIPAPTPSESNSINMSTVSNNNLSTVYNEQQESTDVNVSQQQQQEHVEKDMTITRSFGEILMINKRQSIANGRIKSETPTTTTVPQSNHVWDISGDVTNNLRSLITPTKTIDIKPQAFSNTIVDVPPASSADVAKPQPLTVSGRPGTIPATQPQPQAQPSHQLGSFFQSNSGAASVLADSTITKTHTNTEIQHLKQYTSTPSFTQYDGEDSFIYGKLNFNRSNLNSNNTTITGRQTSNSSILSSVMPPPATMIDHKSTAGSNLLPPTTTTTTTTATTAPQPTTKPAQDTYAPRPMANEFDASLFGTTYNNNRAPNPTMESALFTQQRQSMMLEDLMSMHDRSMSVVSAVAKTITFNEFLYLSNCRFMDDFSSKSKRASLVGMQMTDGTEECELRTRLINSYCHYRQMMSYRAGYEQLQQMITSTTEANRVAEERMNANNPPIFQVVQRSTKDDLISKQHMLKKIKNTAKMGAQAGYSQWRCDLERKVCEELTASKQQLSGDLVALGHNTEQLKETEMALLVDIQHLKTAEKRLHERRALLVQKIERKSNETDQQLLNQCVGEQDKLAKLATLTHWSMAQWSGANITFSHRQDDTTTDKTSRPVSNIEYKVTFKLANNNTNQILSAKLTRTSRSFRVANGSLATLESRLIDQMDLQKTVLAKVSSIKHVKEALMTVSVCIGRVRRLCDELRQLETLYNLRANMSSSSSSTSMLELDVNMFNSKAMKKMTVKLLVSPSYPNGPVQYSFDTLLGTISDDQVRSVLDTHVVNSNRRGKITKVLELLDNVLSN
ncbi:hypothetical protein SAMD00019534_037220 [Acytostelium subglobosum LB1]|uniref:hypothetical protein n=1 Tax=Acytostelium subglobosum LB1 TaxID=1410327 RepID=UPI000644C4C0|nr:hypothetical protein SAMD00019534_037220 [Acytostelium subglobosum LB1]GAM20547.1 hypothetical protein SAMD00019534_037220 [Acytostelium subglobosum LB1]|eukprot:XP_012760068.1 hypothetical protein SAMD00019534_037220 [Acytostelium subglobosum LB1]